jgi:hypothetical protein
VSGIGRISRPGRCLAGTTVLPSRA